jgi:hypothetical protein
VDSAALAAALRSIALERFAGPRSPAGIVAMSRYVATRTNLSPTAVTAFLTASDRSRSKRVKLAWATKVLTALERPDLLAALQSPEDVAA